jgi:Exonuclease VII small subunit
MEEKNLEVSFKELDMIIQKLESRDITLDESFKIYNTGMQLLKTCNDKIDNVEKKLLILEEYGEADDI